MAEAKLASLEKATSALIAEVGALVPRCGAAGAQAAKKTGEPVPLTTAFGTTYLPMSAYQSVHGVMCTDPSQVKAPAAAPAAPLPSADTPVGLLMHIGLPQKRAEETTKNAELFAKLKDLVDKLGGVAAVGMSKGVLVYDIATKGAAFGVAEPALLSFVKDGKISTTKQLDAGFKFLKKGGDVGSEEFKTEVGYGIAVSEADIVAAVKKAIAPHKAEIVEKRYRFNSGKVMAQLSVGDMKWADGALQKKAIDGELFALLGPKTAADSAKQPKAKKVKQPKAKKAAASGGGAAAAKEIEGAALKLHPVGGNASTSGYTEEAVAYGPHTEKNLAAHMDRVKGQVRTRFPPEPNGILHIGHAKAICFNFGYAEKNNGTCNLRYDDTNPEKEEEEFFVGIRENVEWLGFKPDKITHSSDNFDQLYALAVKLIKDGNAYVCHQDAADMKGFAERKYSPWRDRPVAESLQLFEDMKRGKVDEGAATLRLKHVMTSGKLDPVAWRVIFKEHHRTGNAWCMYPTYEFTHCLCDSIEDITHSLCTKEFQGQRPSYYWICNVADVYCPVQWEYSRLNVKYTVVSKRKIAKLIEQGIVDHWDDPRLFTLSGLRRRGIPAEAIKKFCALVGVTEATDTMIHPQLLDSCARARLNLSAHRAMAVIDPIELQITNLPAGLTTVTVDDIPAVVEGRGSTGTHDVDICSTVYISRDDFSENPDAKYKRLTATQSVGLQNVGLIFTPTEVVKAGGVVTKIVGTVVHRDTYEGKRASYIQWVSSKTPAEKPKQAEIRMYKQLFLSELPPGPHKELADDVNPNSLTTVHAYVDKSVATAAPGATYQFVRSGFFTVDKGCTADNLVFNLTVELKGEK